MNAGQRGDSVRQTVLMPFVGAGTGGATISAGELARRLQDETPYAPLMMVPGEGTGTAYFEDSGLTIRLYSQYGASSSGATLPSTSTFVEKLKALPAWIRLFRLADRSLKNTAPALLHLNEDKLIIPWGVAAKRLGIPVVWHVRQERPSRYLDPMRLRLADYLIFVADANRSRFTGFNRIPPSATIHNVVNLDRFRPAADKARAKMALGLDPGLPTLTFLGHLVPRKRPEWVIQASIELQNSVPHQLLLIGPLLHNEIRLKELQDLAGQAINPDSIHFLGMRTDVPRLLEASDVLTLPSIPQGEAFPRAIIEAMAVGVPAVATDIAGVREAITHDRNGIIVPPDDFEAYVAAVKLLLTDKRKREELGRAALQTARERFNGSNLAMQTAQIYETLLAER